MAQKISKLICDTGVISRIITKEKKYLIALKEIELKYKIVISTTTKIELYKWIYNYKHKLGAKDFNEFVQNINNFEVIKIDKLSSAIAETLAVKHFDSGVGDLLTAAIALHKKDKLFTINTKDFKRIKGINLYSPPNF